VGLAVGVGDGEPDCAQYTPPLSDQLYKLIPPHTSISLPIQTAVCQSLPSGALPVVLVALQLSVSGLYLPPVFKRATSVPPPPHTIISSPVHTAV
jgi:hypothetical protein